MREKPLEIKVFNIAMSVIVVMFIYGVSYRLWLRDYNMALIDALGLTFACGLFYYSKLKKISGRLIMPLIIFIMSFNIFFWFKQGGLSGNGMMYFSSLVIAIIIVTDRWRDFITILFLVLELILIALDKYFHHWTIWGESNKIPYDFSIMSVLVIYIIWFLKKNYSIEHKKIRNFSRSLKELHRLNLTQVYDLDHVLNDYLNTGANILKLNGGLIAESIGNTYVIKNINSANFTDEQANEILSENLPLLNEIKEDKATKHADIRDNNKSRSTTFIGTPLVLDNEVGYILAFFSDTKSKKNIEDFEIEILELMALNISYLFSMRIWKDNQKVIKNALQQSEQKFKTIFDSANTGISVSDRNGKILMSNPALQRLIGCTESELTNKYFYAYSHPDDLEEDLRLYEELIIGKITHYQLEKRLIDTAGNTIYINMTVSVTQNDKEGEQFVITIFDNITSRKLAEQEVTSLNQQLADQVDKLEFANKELEAFSYSVSHDLRAPLRAIDGFSKMVIEDYQDKLDDEANRLLGVITTNSQKMSTLIDDLLTFSRISRQVSKFHTIDLQVLVDETIQELGFDPKIFKVGALPEISGEKTMIKQVYSNLISNAVKFSSKKKKPLITIGVEDKGGNHELFVSDNGVGFDMRYYDKLFGVFQRLHTDEEFKGTGVGLAIVEKVITKHRGKIWAESEIDKKTTFYFSLPKIENEKNSLNSANN